MSPAVVFQCPVLLICFLSLLLLAPLPTVQGSALLQRMHNGNALGIVPGDSVFEQRWDDPAPGTKAFAGFQQRGVIDLARRDCLPNGTNFCFGDSVNFCASCGTCCVDGIYCCGAGGICCGTGCCASGQTCDSGKCVVSATPITVTAISYQTVTRTVTQIATVVVVVVDTSTIVRETEITVSNEQTQTNIVWVTETILARRALATAEPRSYPRRENDEGPLPRRWWESAWRAAWGTIAPRGQRPQLLDDAPQAAPLQRRQATGAPGTVAPVPTVTKFVTETVESTKVISETITTQSTSIVLTTVTRTNTKVLNARTTIDVTSIITITNHEPVTQFITTTENPVRDAPTTLPRTSSATSSPTNLSVVTKSSSLQTPAIVGISIGGIAAAAIIIAIVIFWFRYRRKRHENDNPNADLPPNVNDLDIMREPAYPALKHFVSQRASAHHSVQFQPPAGGMAGLAAAAGAVYNDSDDPNKSSGGSSPLTPDPRASSVYSSNYNTLVGTPGNGKPRDRVSAMTAASGYGAAAEVPGSEWTDDDIDRTSSVSPAVSSAAPGAGRGSRRLSQQHVHQLQQIQQQQYQQLQQQQQYQQQQNPPRHSRQHSYSFGSQNGNQPQYQQPQPSPPPEELDSTPVMEMGPGGADPPLIPPRLRPTQSQGLHVVNGDDNDDDEVGRAYDGASWGIRIHPGYTTRRSLGAPRGRVPGRGR